MQVRNACGSGGVCQGEKMMNTTDRTSPAGQQGDKFQSGQAQYTTTPHPYLERKGINLAALQAACKCKVEIRPTTLGDFRGLAVFRELDRKSVV